MARAVIPVFAESFPGIPDIQDDITDGWKARFQVYYTGSGASGGFMVDFIEVHFADTDLVPAMETKMRDAARTRGVELGITGAATMNVIAMIAPKRL
jgi:hypothetical protein